MKKEKDAPVFLLDTGTRHKLKRREFAKGRLNDGHD